VGGRDFVIPIQSGVGLDLLTIAPEEERFVALLRSLLADRPGAIVDVGANIGRFLLLCAATNLARPYVGFEVHLLAANYLDQLIRANRLPDHSVFATGLSDAHHVLELHTNGQYDVKATTIEGHYSRDHFTQRYPVIVDAGDRILDEFGIGPIALIKVDVEGGEREVLMGLARTIERYRPTLILEVAPYQHVLDLGEIDRAAFRKERIQKLEAWLTQRDYRFSKIEGGSTLRPVTTLDPGMSRDTKEMDYVCTAG